MVPRENKNNAYAKFEGTNEDYYSIFRSDLFFTFEEGSKKSMRIDFLELESVKSDNKVLNDYIFFLTADWNEYCMLSLLSKDENGCGDHCGSSKRDKIAHYGRWGRTSHMTICLFYT